MIAPRHRPEEVAFRRAPSCPPLLGRFFVIDASGNPLGDIEIDDFGNYRTDQGHRGTLREKFDEDDRSTGWYTFQEPPSNKTPPQPDTTEWGWLWCPPPHDKWHWQEATGQRRSGTIEPPD